MKKQINGQLVYVENDKFGLRFFPPELARSPSPVVMPAEKSKTTYRIFVLGGSAALGDPEPAFGFVRYLQVLLEERFPGVRFEVVCTAMTAINSHVIVPIARECARREGDLWVIYMGNNEFVGPFGAGTVFGPQTPSLAFIHFSLAVKATRIGQLLDALRRSIAPKASGQRSWGGMKMFLENQVGPDDPRRERVYACFQRNLKDILREAGRANVEAIVSTVASNLKDCAPFASSHSSGQSGSEQDRWKQLYNEAAAAELAGKFNDALSNYLAAAKIDGSFADLQFRIGRSFLALTNRDEARRHFKLARDFDALPFRADTRLNQIIRKTATDQDRRGIHFVDAEVALNEKSPGGIAGDELFFEHVHFNFDGNYELARIFASQIEPLLPDTITKQNRGEWASAEVCERKLALTDWDRRRVYGTVLRRFTEAPFINQINHSEQFGSLSAKLASLRARLKSEPIAPARAVYEEAMTARPADFYLRGDFAKLLEDTGDIPGAITEWQRVRDLIPFEPAPYYFAGKLLAREGKNDAAIEYLSRALQIRPELPDALDEKGQLLVKQQKAREALPLLEKAMKLQPGNARICVHLADALAALNRRPEALDKLREAVRLDPAYWEARYLLGVELAVDGNVQQAAEQFLEVVRLSPNYAAGHLNLGVALARLGRMNDALTQFHETLRLDPNNRKAAEYLESARTLQRGRP